MATVHDNGGAFRIMNAPFRLSGADTTARDFAAARGEHSRALLTELGYGASDIDALSADGIVGEA